MKYVGARYMPKFVGTHDPSTAYEALSVVDNGMGTSYVSNKPVPVNTPLSDTEYWIVYGTSSGAILNLQNQIDEIKDGFVIPEMFGAKADGVTDDTAAINTAIAACPNVVFTNNTYMVNADIGILPEDGTHLFLSEGTVLKGIAPVSDVGDIIHISEKNNIVIEGGTIDGNRSGAHSQHAHGISIETCDNVIVNNVHVKDCKGDGIYIGSYLTNEEWTVVYPSHNVKVLNCLIENTGRNGISPVACEGMHIIDTTIKDIQGENPQAGIDIEVNNDSYPVTDYVLSGLHISNCVGYGLIIPRYNNNGIVTNCIFDESVRIECGLNFRMDSCLITGSLDVDGRDGNDKVFTNCKIRNVIVGQSDAYKLELVNCEIGNDSDIGQATFYTDLRSVDVAGNVDLIVKDSYLFDNGTNPLLQIIRKPKNLVFKNTRFKCRTRYTLQTTDNIIFDGCDFWGIMFVLEMDSPIISFINNLIHGLTANTGTYNYILSIRSANYNVVNNVFSGTSPESVFIKANYSLSPIGSVAFNTIPQFANVGATDGTVKISYNVLSGT